MYKNVIKVLLVEDNEDDYLLTRDLLLEAGPARFELTWAMTYQEALEAIKQNVHDVCLVDYRLGEYNGVELLRESTARGYKTQAILLTSEDDHDVDEKAMKAGAVDYLIKGQINKPLLERSIRYAIERAKTLDALRSSENKYRQMVETSLEGILLIDNEVRINYVNQRMAELLGYSVDELLGRTVFEFVEEDLRPQAERNFERRRRGISEQLEFRFTRKDGTALWALISTAPLRGPDGESTGALAMLSDITERKRTEEKLRHQLEFTKAITASLGEGIYALDSSGRVTFMNPAAEAALGWTQSELLGKEIHRIIHFQHADGTPRPARECELLGVLGSGQTATVDSDVFTRKDGSLLPVSHTSSPIISGVQVVGAVLAFHDITERKYAEEVRERLAAIVESSQDAILSKTVDGFITSWNIGAEKMYGYTAAEAVGTHISLISPPERIDELEKILVKLRRGERIEHLETVRVRKDGTRIDVSISISPIKDDRGRIVGCSTIGRNISERKRAEEALRQSEERYRELVENARDIIYSHDLEGNYTSVNKACEQITGYTREESLKMNLSQIIAPEYLEKSSQMLTRKLAGEEEMVYELEMMAKDGRRIAVEVNTRLIYQDGIPVSVQGIARDITARKRAEEERDRFFDLSGDLLCTADFNGYFKRLNPAWSKTLGFSEEELLSEPFDEFVHPDDRINTTAEVETLAAGGATINFENRYICKDGSYRWLSWSSTSVSERQTIYAVARDVTEIKQATEALREADKRAIKEYKHLLGRIASLAEILGSARDLATIFRALLIFARLSAPASGMLISLYDTATQVRQPVYAWSDGEEVDISKLQPMTNSLHSRAISAGELGIIMDDLQTESAGKPKIDIGDLCADRLPQSSLDVPMAVMGKVIGGVEIQSLELAAFREEHATAMQMAANLAANAIENVRLMDNEHEREEQLRQSQKMEAVGRLAGGVAHDFNNLLTAITGYSELTLKRLPGEDPLRRNVEEIKKAGERAASLTRQLLAFSRKQVLQPVVLDLQAVVSDMEKMLRRLIGEDIELRTVLGGELGSIKADPGQIEQVIMNLAVNARDAMPAGGKLTIETQNVYLGEDYATRHIAVKPGAYIMMAVTDTGTGMDEQTQRRIFEPFFTTKELGKGTGLGLSTVYGIVKQSGGNIWVYSEVHRGTTFKIYLPRVDEGAQDYKRSVEVEESLYGTETILVAEDDERLRNLVREVLEGYSYKVLLAANGSVALSIFERQEEPIHLLLTDVIMPGMSGRELADRLTRLHPEIKTLYMSGYTDDAIVHHGVLDADTSFIQKPFASAALARKVREVLGQSTGQGLSDKNSNNS